METFTTNVLTSKTPSTIKGGKIKGGKCSHWEKNARTPIWEMWSVMDSFHFLKGSNSCRAEADCGGKKINTSPKMDLPTQLIKLWHSKNKNSKAQPEGQIFFKCELPEMSEWEKATGKLSFSDWSMPSATPPHPTPPYPPPAWGCRRLSKRGLGWAGTTEAVNARAPSQQTNAQFSYHCN